MRLELQLGILLLTTQFLFGCNPSPEVVSEPVVRGKEEINSEQEIAHVKKLLTDSLVSFVDSLDSVIINGETVSKLQEMFKNPNQEDNNNDDDEKDLSEIKQDLPNFFELLLASPQYNSSIQSVSYKPNPEICNQVLAKNDPASCRVAMGRITIHHVITGHLKGHLSFYFDAVIPFTLSYDEKNFSLSSDLSQFSITLARIDEIIKSMGDEDMDDVPTISGMAKISFERLSSAQIRISLASLADVHFSTTTKEGEVNIDIEESPSLAQFNIDSGLKLATLGINLHTVSAHFPVHNDNAETKEEHPELDLALNFDGLLGNIVFSDSLKTVSVTNFGITGDHILRLDVNDTRALEVFTSNLNFGLDANYEKLHFLAKSDLTSAIVVNSNLAFNTQGLLTLSLPRDSELEITPFYPLNASSYLAFKVLTGSFQAQGSEGLDGSLGVSPNQCFRERFDSEVGFPFSSLEVCP